MAFFQIPIPTTSRYTWPILSFGAFVVPPMMIYLAAIFDFYSSCTPTRMTIVVMAALVFGLAAILQTGFRQWLLTVTACIYVCLMIVALPLVALSASCHNGMCCG